MHTIAPMRVLVVDDDDDSAMAMALLLSRYGHQTAVAEGGEAALQKAPVFRPEVMFIDLAMPEVDGLTVARQLRQMAEFAETPLVAVSGYVDSEHRIEASDAGFNDFLPKPFTLDDLRRTLKRVRERIDASRAQIAMSQGITEQVRRLNSEWRSG